jgi:hypothetical protein
VFFSPDIMPMKRPKRKPGRERVGASEDRAEQRQTRRVLERWGALHAGRSALGPLGSAVSLPSSGFRPAVSSEYRRAHAGSGGVA